MKIFNTLTRQKEAFKPMDPQEVKIYACGPTVYNFIHIGNARPLCVFDVLRRYLEYRGYGVKFVQNFTDIDDKIIKRANEEGKTYQDSYAITGGSYDANPTSIEIRPGETTEATFYLKDGDTVHIENLPYGVEYKVSETPVADYVTTETGTEGEVDEAVEQANFTNTKGGTVDAGVVLDSAPYLFTLTGAAGVGLLLTLRRRHQK